MFLPQVEETIKSNLKRRLLLHSFILLEIKLSLAPVPVYEGRELKLSS